MKECLNISQLLEHCSGEEGLISNEWCIKCPLIYELNIKFENRNFLPNFLCIVCDTSVLFSDSDGRQVQIEQSNFRDCLCINGPNIFSLIYPTLGMHLFLLSHS